MRSQLSAVEENFEFERKFANNEKRPSETWLQAIQRLHSERTALLISGDRVEIQIRFPYLEEAIRGCWAHRRIEKVAATQERIKQRDIQTKPRRVR